MRAFINEVEIQMSEHEQDVIKMAQEITGTPTPEIQNPFRPQDIRSFLSTIGRALEKDITTEQRVRLLDARQDLREMMEGIQKAESTY